MNKLHPFNSIEDLIPAAMFVLAAYRFFNAPIDLVKVRSRCEQEETSSDAR
jgi:hypothetical protein